MWWKHSRAEVLIVLMDYVHDKSDGATTTWGGRKLCESHAFQRSSQETQKPIYDFQFVFAHRLQLVC